MIAERKPFRAHAFEYACATNDVDHRLTKPKHPWTNGQVERINRTIKDATVKRYFFTNPTSSCKTSRLRDFVERLQLRQKASRPSKASPLTNSSVRHGLHSPSNSNSTRSSKCRD